MKINFVNLKKKKMRLFDYSWFDNYDEKIWDGDLYCTDMYYYSKDLKKNKL